MRFPLVCIPLFGALALLCAVPAGAQSDETGVITGQVLDGFTGAPLPGATVRLRDLDVGQATGDDGTFRFDRLRPRRYTLTVSFIGYAPQERTVRVAAGDTASITLSLPPSRLDLPDVVVTGTARERGASDAYRPTTAVAGEELQRSLDSSVPASLERVPGVAAQYNGPGAATLSIRGMGGDRVLMLEDGQRTGDLYASASDHGVTMEALTAERMEVVRGPAGLLYGSNALGGVVNVIRDDVPRSRPETPTGTVTLQAQSVNEGAGGGATVEAPLGPLAVRGELSARGAGDTETPQGPLPSTGMQAINASAGASWVSDWGFVGVAHRFYDNTYGVPGEFDGELIEGGHPGGVDIETMRQVTRFRAAYQRRVLDLFDAIELDAHHTRYHHDEIESRGEEGETFFGARFEQATSGVNLVAHHEHDQQGLRLEGAVGASAQHRALRTSGASPGSRSADEQTASAFAYEEFGWAALRLQVGARYDARHVAPLRTASITLRTAGRRIEKPVSARTFGAFSGSIAMLYDLDAEWTLGASFARSFRNPSIEELYSDGPHLADFSFDIGSPDLDSEYGHGFDVFLRVNRPRLSLELAGYLNRVDNYIYYRPTGETVLVDREGDFGRVTPVYEARGDDADFLGGEGRVQWEALGGFVVDATASYTRATRRTERDPLPAIPPLNGTLDLRYEWNDIFGSVGLKAAAEQNRVPDPVARGDERVRPEEPTDGHGLLHASLGWRHVGSRLLHTVTLTGNNLTDAVWRDHLSRIKDVAPQPGRNVRLTYRVQF